MHFCSRIIRGRVLMPKRSYMLQRRQTPKFKASHYISKELHLIFLEDECLVPQ